jgi:1A family penicillin-binding protein
LFATAVSTSIHTPGASPGCEADYTLASRVWRDTNKSLRNNTFTPIQSVALRLLNTIGMRRTAVIAAVFAVAIGAWYATVQVALAAESIVHELERARSLADLAPRPEATIVYDRYGKPAFTFFVEQRIYVPLDHISPRMIEALLSAEDRRFYSHHGIDPIRIAGAAWRNVRAGRILEGGSTITQQLARASLSSERTYDRKIREILLATQLEKRYTKAQILEQYLNTVYLGDGYYGVEAASRGYFGKSACNLDPHEAALLAALVRSPSNDAPSVGAARALKRRNLVLRLMRDQGLLADNEYRQESAAALVAVQRPGELAASAAATGGDSGLYFQEEIRRQLFALFGADRVLRSGLRVYSTYDPELQRQAESAVTTRIAEIVKTRPAARDLQGSFVALDPATGDVRALVGGRDFNASSFNRATQARRQAGSAFKPIIYAAALERGYSPGTLLRDLDTPITSGTETWLPAGGHEDSEYTLRSALKVSSNRAAAQLLQQIGVSSAVYYAQRLGIESQLPMVPSLALGTGEVTLLELTTAYTAFANHGRVAAPRLVTRVEDARGATIFTAAERHTQAINPTTAYLMSSMLSDVVSGGTGSAARAAGFKLPAAGKTGTTDNYADAWFVGYTPHLVAGIWFGLDRPAPIMRGGFAGVVAVPAWGRFMRAATAGDKPDWYEMPADVEKVAICRVSGARATDACRHQADLYSVARDGTSPQLVPVDALFDQDDQKPVRTLAAGEPPVYEDLFPIGAVSAEICPVHNPSAGVLGIASSALAPSPSPVATSGTFTTATSDIVLERVLGADGLMHMVMRQRR